MLAGSTGSTDRDMKRVNYRKLAFEQYPPVCAHCGFGIADVLEVCHLDCQRTNNHVGNLVILCPTCHKMHDLDLISTETICTMRDRSEGGPVGQTDEGRRSQGGTESQAQGVGARAKAALGSFEGCGHPAAEHGIQGRQPGECSGRRDSGVSTIVGRKGLNAGLASNMPRDTLRA